MEVSLSAVGDFITSISLNKLRSRCHTLWKKTGAVTLKSHSLAPKGKNYRVKLITCNFKSPLADENCNVTCDYIVEATSGDFPN